MYTAQSTYLEEQRMYRLFSVEIYTCYRHVEYNNNWQKGETKNPHYNEPGYY
jgi:hypothetical protein